MKIVSFNINSIRARPHQVEAIVKKHNPDAIGFQETKVHDDDFPYDIPESLGYKAHIHGQKVIMVSLFLQRMIHILLTRDLKQTLKNLKKDLYQLLLKKKERKFIF